MARVRGCTSRVKGCSELKPTSSRRKLRSARLPGGAARSPSASAPAPATASSLTERSSSSSAASDVSPRQLLSAATPTALSPLLASESSASLGAIARGSGRTLAELNLTWCVGVDAAGGALLARHWRRPRLLSLHGLARIDGGALAALARHTAAAETLTTLDVSGCVSIPPEMRTREGLLELFPRLPSPSR